MTTSWQEKRRSALRVLWSLILYTLIAFNLVYVRAKRPQQSRSTSGTLLTASRRSRSKSRGRRRSRLSIRMMTAKGNGSRGR